VKPLWDDLNARARGLGTHLLSRLQLEGLARELDLPALGDGLRRFGIATGESGVTVIPEDLELAIRRWAAARLRTLARWAGPRASALPTVFEDEDRRSLRAILRGAVHGSPAERRLAGLVPTPALPERALMELARAPTASAVATLLAAWRHPYAAALAPAIGTTHPDLFALELSLARMFADRTLRAARRAGDRGLLRFARETIDLENALSAVVLTVEGKDVVPKDVFLPGGERVSIVAFEEAIALGEPGSAGARLAVALGDSPIATALHQAARDPAALEDDLLRARLHVLARRVRQAPLGALPVLWFGLRLRAQVVDLRRIVWAVTLGAPRGAMVDSLVTAA
jgi:vacuolar-type H+-ATPase subunit C/Vma6